MSPELNQPSRDAILRAITGGHFAGHWGQWTKKNKRTQFFTSDDLDEFSARAEKFSKTDDVYMCISAQEEDVGPNKRGSIDSVATVFAFAADIDFSEEKDSGMYYPPRP